VGHQGSAGGHGSRAVSTFGAEHEPAAPDLVKQRENSAAGVDELPAERHGSAARGDDDAST